MEQIIQPDAINLEDDAVVILWEDAHRSPFPHRFLRLRCPCANCVDEMSGKRTLDPDTVPQDVKALDQMPVGKYGVQFLWSDAHYTGIYTFKVERLGLRLGMRTGAQAPNRSLFGVLGRLSVSVAHGLLQRRLELG